MQRVGVTSPAREGLNVDYNKKETMKIYIAGPYSAKPSEFDSGVGHDAARQTHRNTRKAIWAGIEVMKRGHMVYIPHLSHFIHCEMSGEDMKALPDYPQYWYHFDNEWLKVCDALLYIGKSTGADSELALAKSLGKIIYYGVGEIPHLVTLRE